jgi:hypothetical protein
LENFQMSEHYEILTPISKKPGDKPQMSGTILLDADDAEYLLSCGAIRALPQDENTNAAEQAKADTAAKAAGTGAAVTAGAAKNAVASAA